MFASVKGLTKVTDCAIGGGTVGAGTPCVEVSIPSLSIAPHKHFNPLAFYRLELSRNIFLVLH